MNESIFVRSDLALLGGPRAVTTEPKDLFDWPIVTEEHEQAVLEALRARKMSGRDITQQFEAEYARAIGRTYALGCNNGTAAIHCGLYGMGVGVGDEVIVPSITYWASALPLYSLGATPVFADVDPETLCIDPAEIERWVSPRTKAVVVVHYAGMPADMDAIMPIAEKHGLMVLEDASHAHGTLYKGKEAGTFGVAAAFSLMTGKSLAIGEAGILFTDDQRVYERALLFGHYARHRDIELPDLKARAGLPCGGYKYRMHQLSSAFGLVELGLYPQRVAEIDRAMNRFCDLVADVPGFRPVRPAADSGSTKGGWYFPRARYDPEAFGGLSVGRFAEAVVAEGSECHPGCNWPLHLHPVFSEVDVYGHGRPTRVAHLPQGETISQPPGSLPVSESVSQRVLGIPWFKHDRPDVIAQPAEAFRKLAASYKDLLPGDEPDRQVGGYSTART